MSKFAKSTSSPRATRPDIFARTAPTMIQSFEEFQNSRMDRLNEVQADLDARRAQEIRDLQIKLQDLTMQLNTTQAAMADDERSFVNRREALITELHQIKTHADIQFSQEQVSFMQERDRMQKEHDDRFRELAKAAASTVRDIGHAQDTEELMDTKRKVKKLEENVRKFQQSSIKNRGDDEEAHEHEKCRQMYMDRISDLEDQKRELIQAIKEDERNNDDRLNDLQAMIDDQDNQFKIEREEIEEKMARKEEKYKETIDKLYTDLERIQTQRSETMATRKERVEDLQAQIDRVETEFKAKLREANRITEKLKTALMNTNLRKMQQMEVEKERSREQQQLMKESFQLQQRMYTAEKHLQKAKEEGSLLRRELSAKIGPRKTASLFM